MYFTIFLFSFSIWFLLSSLCFDEVMWFSEGMDDEFDRGPALETYGTDLTILAREGYLDECFGRDEELLELMEILVRRQKNNPVLVGDAGVGKTAIVELFATKIVNNLVPFILEGRTIVSLDLARIVAGSRYRGEFELRLQRVLDEVLEQPHIILFIDEIHNISGTGSAEGSLDAANILKPILSRSGFQCIGATTTKEYERIAKDPALNRRFQPIQVGEPSIDDTVQILFGLRASFEGFHNIAIQPSALRVAAELSSRYIYDRFLPDKAIDLVDRAAAKAVIEITNVTEGSVIGSIVNALLAKLGKLRVEAFRRGDVASEFIFQEIDNAYRNFLLRWVESPLKIPEDPKPLISPIGQGLFDTMRLSVLRRVDELLFSSNKPRSKTRQIQKVKLLSDERNQEIYSDLYYSLDNLETENIPETSVYRTGLYLYGQWIGAFQISFQGREAVTQVPYWEPRVEAVKREAVKKASTGNMITHLRQIREDLIEDPISFSRDEDFCLEDIETYEQTFEILSELEEKRIRVVKDFLRELRPILRKGIVQSLKGSSRVEISEKDLSLIYTLLGYFSTETGRTFLADLEDPELIRIARKTGDFTGLKRRLFQGEIRDLVSHMTGIPIQGISSLESKQLMNLEDTLHKRVIGQSNAVSAIAKAIRRSRLGIQNPTRPIASFLFCGPTGVGKTEVTKALASTLFGSEKEMIRFDMSEFMEKFTISRLIGSPPGYIGYEEGGQLTDAVRRKPYSVVLFDEVEKAHPDILNILLQILEDGRLTDTQKRLVPFENTVIIMTSNAAAEEIQQIILNHPTRKKMEASLNQDVEEKSTDDDEKVYVDEYAGPIKFFKSKIKVNYQEDLSREIQKEMSKSILRFKEQQERERQLELAVEGVEEAKKEKELQEKEENEKLVADLKSAVLDCLGTMFLPEFLNRLDDIIIFEPLRPEELRKICDLMIQEVEKRVESKKIELVIDRPVRMKLTREGYNPQFGARPLRRLITKYVEDLISEAILNNPLITKPRRLTLFLDTKGKISMREEILSNKEGKNVK